MTQNENYQIENSMGTLSMKMCRTQVSYLSLAVRLSEERFCGGDDISWSLNGMLESWPSTTSRFEMTEQHCEYDA